MGRFKRSKSKKKKKLRLAGKEYFFINFHTFNSEQIKDSIHEKIILAEIGISPLAQKGY